MHVWRWRDGLGGHDVKRAWKSEDNCFKRGIRQRTERPARRPFGDLRNVSQSFTHPRQEAQRGKDGTYAKSRGEPEKGVHPTVVETPFAPPKEHERDDSHPSRGHRGSPYTAVELTKESQRSGVACKAGRSLAIPDGCQYSGRQARRERRHVDHGSGNGVESSLPQSRQSQVREAKVKSGERKGVHGKKTIPIR